MTPEQKAIDILEKLIPHVYNEYDGSDGPSEYIGDITDDDKIEGILDRAMQPKEVREQILFLNWLLKHYSTETDPEGFFLLCRLNG